MQRRKKDPMEVGYKFMGSDQNKKPADFLTDPETGFRPGQREVPHGGVTIDLKYGTLDYRTLPPLEIWRKGHFFKQHEDKDALPDVREHERRECWVVSGEGTPGNYKSRAYLLPTDEAAKTVPQHPSLWEKKGYTSGWESTPLPPKLPLGLRIRCPGCGHWYRMDDLGDHADKCCPAGDAGPDGDWAIKCECCVSLDDTAKIKAGFPRKPVKKEEKEKVTA